MAIRTTGVRYDLIARDSASRTFDRVAGRASLLERGLGKLGKAATVAGAALAGGLVVGLADGAKKAVTFQAEMLKISTQASATTKDVGVLSKQVLALGKTTQQGPQQLAESLYHLKSVGMDNVSAMKALKEASDLAAVGHANLEETTNALAGAWRTGIKGATSFHEAVSTVNAIIGAGNMSMGQFNAAIGTGILPSAKTFGLSLKQVGAALALMTDEGIDSASAATRLRMSFSLLGAPSKAAEKQLAKIGLTGLQLADAMRGRDGLIGAIGLLKDHLDKSGMSASQQSQVLSRAFGGGRSSSGILLMINNLDVLRKKQEQVNRSAGRFDDAVVQQRKTVAAQFAIIKSNLDVFAIEAGNKLLPPITSFVTYITRTALPTVGRLGSSLGGMVPTDKIKGDFAAVSDVLGDFVGGLRGPKKVKLAAPSISMPATKIPATLAAPESSAAKLGTQLRTALTGGIGDAIDRIQWGKLGTRIGSGLATAIGWVGEHTADLTKKLGTVLKKIDWVGVGKSFGQTAIPLAIGIVTSLFSPLFTLSFWQDHWLDTIMAVLSIIPIGRIAGPLAKGIEKIPVLKIFTPLLRGVERMGKPVEGAVGKVVGFFGRSLWTGISRVFPEGTAVLEREAGLFTTRIGVWALDLRRAGTGAIRGLGNGVKSGFGWVIAKLGEGIAQILRPFAAAGGWLIKRGAQVVSGLRSGIAGGAARIGEWVGARMVAPVKGAFTGAGSWLLTRGSAVVSGLKSGVSTGASRIGSWMGTHVTRPVKGAFTSAGSWLKSAGSSLMSGLKSGITDGIKGIGGWLKSNLVDPVVNAVKHWFGIHSPSKVFQGIGGHLVSGLVKGLATSNGLDIAKRVFGDLPSALAAIVGKGLVSIEQLPSKALSALRGLGGKGMKLLGAAGENLFPSPSSHMSSNMALGRQMMLAAGWPPGEWQALRDLWSGESGWRTNAINKASGAYGIPQALPASKMESAGPDWLTNPATQIAWGLSYIKQRYGTPRSALAQWMSRSPHWYAAGGLAPIGQTAWVGERGPELMQVTSRGTRIYSNRDSMALAGAVGMQVPGYAKGTVSLPAARRDVSAAQREVDRLEKEIYRLRRDEATTHSKSRRHADRLAIMTEEERLKAARTELTKAKKELSTAERQAKAAAAAERAQAKRIQGISNTLQNGFLRTLETGSAAAIASAIKSLNTRLQAAGFGRLVAGNLRTSSRLQSLANQRSSLQSRIATAQQYASDQAGGLGDFLSLSNIPSSSLSSLISRMQAKQGQASGFAREVAGLSKRGLDKSLLAQLAEAGPGSQLAALFLKANAGDIKQLNQLAKSQAKLTTSFGQTMANAMYDSGAQAGKGFLSGLKAQEKQLQAEMNHLAEGMVKTIEHKLGIHSPSTVTRDRIGKPFALGAAVGVRQYAPHAAREAQRMADTMAAVRARSGAVPVAAGGGQAVHHTEHHITTYEINARTADFTPQQLEVLQRRAEARQRVGRPR